MDKMLIIIIGLAIILIYFIRSYNKMLRLSDRVLVTWRQVDSFIKQYIAILGSLVKLLKRNKKIPNLTLEKLEQAQHSYLIAVGQREKMLCFSRLCDALTEVFSVKEYYEDLQKQPEFTDLEVNMTNLQEQVSRFRQFYNDFCFNYNEYINRYPNRIVAAVLGFVPSDYFEIN